VTLPSRHGVEFIVDARGCDPAKLADRSALVLLLEAAVAELGLHPIGRPAFHEFPVTRGHTGFWMLMESHLAVHTWPEHGSLCLNLFCCRPRPAWDWKRRLAELVGAAEVDVHVVRRDYAGEPLRC
jgi:S-adenosylmethionine decarboxylase